MANWTNTSKNSTTFANISKKSLTTNAGFDTAKFDVSQFDDSLATYSHAAKNTASYTNITKN